MSSISDSLVRLVKSASVIFVGTVLARALGFLGEVFIIRSLAPESFGVVALAYTTVLTLSRIGLLGIPNGVTRHISAADSLVQRESILQSGYIIALGCAIVLTAAVFVLRKSIANLLGTDQISGLLVFFLPFILVYSISRVSISALRAQQFSASAIFVEDLGPRALALIAFTVFAVLSRPFIGAVVYWVTVPISSALLAILFLYFRGSIYLSFRTPDTNTLKKLWSFSWPLAIGSSLILLMSNLDVLMIGFFLDSREVGFYRSVKPLRQATGFILSSFVFLFLPLATKFYSDGEYDKLNKLYVTASKWVSLGTLPFVLVFSLFSANAIEVFFGNQYVPAAPVLSVLIAGLFFNTLVGPNGAMIKAIDKPRIEMYAASAGLATNVVLNIILIPVFGIIGAAVATVIGYIIFNSIEVLVIYVNMGSHPFTLNTMKPLVATAVVGIGLARLSSNIEFGLLELILFGIVLSIVQLSMVFVTKSYEETDRFILEQIKARAGIK